MSDFHEFHDLEETQRGRREDHLGRYEYKKPDHPWGIDHHHHADLEECDGSKALHWSGHHLDHHSRYNDLEEYEKDLE